MKNITVNTFREHKQTGEKLTMITCYDYTTAKLVDQSGIDSILVGDSLGMTMLGYDDTLSVTLDDMIHHSAAVARGAKHPLIICDMPFMTYSTGTRDAVMAAGRLIQEGHAHAVKLEGGTEVQEEIKAIVAAKIPVCAHIGLTPQSVNTFGGFKVQGKDQATVDKLLADAKAVEEAGAFAVVMECVPAPLAKKITDMLTIPTIGIGAGVDCDGQVLVYQDMLGMFGDFVPKFVKQFAHIGEAMVKGFKDYDDAVKNKTFPRKEHEFTMDTTLLEEK